jgi:hypothetical protein
VAILVSAGEQVYSPLARTLNFTVAADATWIEARFTHPNTLAAWPNGPLIEYEILWNGVPASKGGSGGGVRNGKDGQPLSGNVVNSFGESKPPGATSGSVRITTTQTMRTAIEVEAT